ncbi:hypothetical protein QEZ54_18035 [Catellatospora sp. KI3]|uniref:thrombospondin type 3 repeat-containing protein n=1 Tax=Catellatospora sp. KI3 TaxID=3041620 RepID=UPI0024829D74|nr:hypothetical protein [Catellatospora sp. KI3]MDI1462879.1 hypothetical protein [Catellatospora sp. KI3]
MLRRTLAITAAALLTATALTGLPASAAPDQPPVLKSLRLCDATACYIAWRVVDSDGDGVCDADEIVAGTDPYDARSYPGMPLLVELTAARTLPSFEAGLGTFAVIPADVLAAWAKDGRSAEGVFAYARRADALARMGVSAELLAEFGLHPGRGLTIGLGAVAKEGRPAPIGVGTLAVVRASTGFGQPYGASALTAIKGDDGLPAQLIAYANGVKGIAAYAAGGAGDISYANGSGSGIGSKTTISGKDADGNPSVTEMVTDSDGRVESVVRTSRVDGGSWSQTYTESTQYNRDSSGKVTSIIITRTTTTSTQYGSGTGRTVHQCDGSGGNCQDITYPAHGDAGHDAPTGDHGGAGHGPAEGIEPDPATGDNPGGHGEPGDSHDPDDPADGGPIHHDPDDHGYIESDYAGPAFISQEQVDQTLRLRGAAVNVVEGWRSPGLDRDPQFPNLGTIMLVTDAGDTFTVLTEPVRVTEAQPEGRPDLPQPGLPGEGIPPGGCLYCYGA